MCGLARYARVIRKGRGQLTGVFFSSHHVSPNSGLRTASLAAGTFTQRLPAPLVGLKQNNMVELLEWSCCYWLVLCRQAQ